MAIKIKYNGAVIASLGAGQTITLKCAGMKMLSDVVVEADEQGGNDKPSIAAGLYTDNTYSTMTTSWQDLLDAGVVHVDNGVVYTNADVMEFTNSSAEDLVGVLVLPDDGSITELGNIAFSDNSPPVGFCAFWLCDGLTGVIIPASVESISPSAFSDCYNLLSVDLSRCSQLTSIGQGSFSGCKSLVSIKLPSTLTVIDGWLFQHCESLTNVEIPNNVLTIGDYAFEVCVNLANVTFENNSQLTSIGYNAFKDTALTSIEIPACVTSIGEGAFGNCTSLTGVVFVEDSQLTTINRDAFRYSAITSIEIPDGVTSIGEGAFSLCNNLKNVIVLAETPPELGYKTFYDCTALTEIKVPASSVDAYKTADGWSEYAGIIVAI